MVEVEAQKSPKKCAHDHVAQTLLTAIVGFILSIFLILIALIILVRFWVFENIWYAAFVLCYLLIGVIFNIASVNLTLNEYPESLHILPFVTGLPITIFWAIFCIVIPYFKYDVFSQFSQLPIATYDSVFYDGLGYNPESVSIHPFARAFQTESSLFNNTPLIIILFVILGSKLIYLFIVIRCRINLVVVHKWRPSL